jgi:hypothetical protein
LLPLHPNDGLHSDLHDFLLRMPQQYLAVLGNFGPSCVISRDIYGESGEISSLEGNDLPSPGEDQNGFFGYGEWGVHTLLGAACLLLLRPCRTEVSREAATLVEESSCREIFRSHMGHSHRRCCRHRRRRRRLRCLLLLTIFFSLPRVCRVHNIRSCRRPGN